MCGVYSMSVEWCFLHCHRGPGDFDILGKGEPCIPVVLLGTTEYSEILLQ